MSCQQLLGTDPPKQWTDYLSTGHNAIKAGDYDSAVKAYNDAVSTAEKKYGVDSNQTATCLGFLGQTYRQIGQWRLAFVTYKRLIAIKQKTDPQSPDLKQFKEEFGFIQGKMKEYGIEEDPNKQAIKSHSPDKKDKDKKKR